MFLEGLLQSGITEGKTDLTQIAIDASPSEPGWDQEVDRGYKGKMLPSLFGCKQRRETSVYYYNLS